MPITLEDIVFTESQVMDDVPEGGGALTGTVIVDGVMNNVFEDISDLDRALGRFNLRKVGIAVRSADTDLYGGVKTVITTLAEDPDVNYTLFQTGDPFDRRTAAVNRVEAYLYKGPMWHGHLYENHIIGMRTISVLQRVGTELPPIGKTLTLVQNEGLGNETEQYVRAIGVEATETTFTDGSGEFVRWVVSLELSDALRFNFNGHTPSRLDSGYTYTNKTRLRDTTVADATRYYGSHPVTVAGEIGDFNIRAASIFTQLVPTARAETPLANQVMNPTLVQTLSAGARTVEVPQQAHTRALAVTPENRRLNWIETLLPRPASATLSVSYRAQGNWYTLSDAGAGILTGSDPAFGAGTIDYATGVSVVTLGVLPDAGSQVIFIWASPVHYAQAFADPNLDVGIEIRHSVEEPIDPGTLVLTWLVGGVTKTAAGAVDGTLSGDGTGFVSHVVGEFWLRPTAVPDSGSLLGIDYDRVTTARQTFTGVTPAGGLATVNLGVAVEPGSIEAQWTTNSTESYTSTVTSYRYWWEAPYPTLWQKVPTGTGVTVTRNEFTATDNGLGDIGSVGGSVNYATGVVVIPVVPPVPSSSWSPAGTFSWVADPSSTAHAFTSGVIVVDYTPAGATPTAVSTEIALPALTFRVLPRLLDAFVVPNSVRFVWNGQTYDDANGDVIRTGGIVAGSINYLSGTVTLTDYVGGAGAIAVSSLLVRYGDWSAVEASFRALLAPLIPESLSVLVVAEDGETLTGSADADGVISGDYVRGTVNYEYGTAQVEFGAGDPWVSRAVDPSTIRYNAVAYSYIPLDAAILGVDAVRLPPDGRVPIYRKGDVVMVMHPDETTGTPAQVGGVGPYLLNCGRPRLAWVRVTDANGATVDTDFTLDRATGVLSWDSIVGLATPVTVRHTIGDLRLVTDVQINGELTLARPLSHNFPANESLVGSCLLHGDRRARVSETFFQTSWNGTWEDFQVGDSPVWALDVIAHPIEVTNEGAITERWILRWTTTSNVQIVGETRGLVYTGPFTGDLAPINPFTREPDGSGGVPYLTIPLAANGGGQSTGNAARINTVGAIIPLWIARAIGQSDEPLDDGADGCELYALGNINRP